MQLRDYQVRAEAEIHKAWAAGAKNIMIQLPTGSGKTILFTKILAEEKEPSIALAHRRELISQMSLTLARRGIRHGIIAQKSTIRDCVAIQMLELGQSFFDPHGKRKVASVDTLLRLNAEQTWFKTVKLVVIDEGHHVLKDNKWGRVAALFPNARILAPTATPQRADGKGLGRNADGLMDVLITGATVGELTERGHLTKYRIIAPPSDLDLSNVPISASGDYSPPKLRTAVHKSHITGDVVAHYLKFASGKLGVTFAVDIEAAKDITASFREAGVAAEIISSKTPDMLRAQIMKRFRQREIAMLVNVDLLGEGVDVPAIEVVIMARPTQSYSLYLQQFGRALRPMPDKSHAIIIDHVNNVLRHKLPDTVRLWTLDRRERKARAVADDAIPLRRCLNEKCLSVYERVFSKCPFCGYRPVPTARSTPEQVDGDLLELDENTLAALRGEIKRIDSAARVPQNLDTIAQRAIINRHRDRQDAQAELRYSIALWAGYYKQLQREDSEIYKRFYFSFGVDIATAQTFGANDARSLQDKINNFLITVGVKLNERE